MKKTFLFPLKLGNKWIYKKEFYDEFNDKLYIYNYKRD